MVVIAGVVLALGVLYLWLAGHWFGRALAFIVFAMVGVLVALSVSAPGVQMVVCLCAIVLAWLVAWVPMLVRR